MDLVLASRNANRALQELTLLIIHRPRAARVLPVPTTRQQAPAVQQAV